MTATRSQFPLQFLRCDRRSEISVASVKALQDQAKRRKNVKDVLGNAPLHHTDDFRRRELIRKFEWAVHRRSDEWSAKKSVKTALK